MGRPTEPGQRGQLIALKEKGHPLAAISENLTLPFATVGNLSALYQRQGHLAGGYPNRGPKQPTSEALLLRAGRWLNRHHPPWGAPLSRLKPGERYGRQRTPFGANPTRLVSPTALNQTPFASSPTPHRPGQGGSTIWPVEAKEKLSLTEGSPVGYLTIPDEHSGAGLGALSPNDGFATCPRINYHSASSEPSSVG